MLTAPDNRHAANPNTPRSPIIGGRARLTTVRETEIGVGAERAERSETPEPADCRLSRIMDASLR
jgi:hypothetical protein